MSKAAWPILQFGTDRGLGEIDQIPIEDESPR
jgi:hypothetical protein